MPPDNMLYSPVQPPHFLNDPAMLPPNGMPPDTMLYSPVQLPHFMQDTGMAATHIMSSPIMSSSPIIQPPPFMQDPRRGLQNGIYPVQSPPFVLDTEMATGRKNFPIDMSQSKQSHNTHMPNQRASTVLNDPRQSPMYFKKIEEYRKILNPDNMGVVDDKSHTKKKKKK